MDSLRHTCKAQQRGGQNKERTFRSLRMPQESLAGIFLYE